MPDEAGFPRGLELRLLRYFVVVAEELHFGRAAQRLGIAQPPLSQQIGRLETLVGHRLLDRKPRVALTEAGRVLLGPARRALQVVEHGVQATRRAGRGESGMVTVGFAASTMLTALPEVFLEYRRRYPGVELRLREMATAAQMEALLTGSIDVGFLREPAREPGILVQPVLREPFVAALPPGHALAGQERLAVSALSDEPFVLFPRSVAPTLYEQVIAVCRTAGFHPRQVQEAREWLTIVSLVDAGLGVSLVPASFRRLRWGGVSYHALDPAGETTTIALCRRDEGATPALESFLEVARGRMGGGSA